MNELESIQTELQFKKILDDFKSTRIPKPLTKVIYNFENQNTIVSIFDHYVGIQELGKCGYFEYIAVGRLLPQPYKPSGGHQFEVIDVRTIEDVADFEEFIKIFSEQINNNNVPTCDKVGDFTIDDIINQIKITWDLAKEMEGAIIH
jgi:hypothetical protein